MDDDLRDETRVTLLLCGTLGGQRGAYNLLSAREYSRLVTWLADMGLDLASLLNPEDRDLLDGTIAIKLDPLRLKDLLNRKAALALCETWAQRRIWLIDRQDAAYPAYFTERLGESAPPLLWGQGERSLCGVGGLAIVGSRDVDEIGLEFTRRVARQCAEEEIAVVSGGARGVDGAGMQAALDANGRVVGLLPNGLGRTPVAPEYYDRIDEGQLLLLSLYDPAAPFTVGNAMGRNKAIYAFSDWALVTSSAQDSGGTWAGAQEDLKSRWCPLFVRQGTKVPIGNNALIAQGALPFAEDLLEGESCPQSLKEWLDSQSEGFGSGVDEDDGVQQLAMF